MFAALPRTSVDLWAEQEELPLPEGQKDGPRLGYGYTALDAAGAAGRLRAALRVCSRRQRAHDIRREPLRKAADAAARHLAACRQCLRDAAWQLAAAKQRVWEAESALLACS
jgi:predicted dienelactone hydrolase